jgi:ubiquinone/menaquinone biosynthesis C-methylase UbiE
MTYDLRRLRLHDLIERVPHSHRYRITPTGAPIDISPVVIKNARELAKEAHVDAVCEFKVMDADQSEFANDTFDVIHEYGALHYAF